MASITGRLSVVKLRTRQLGTATVYEYCAGNGQWITIGLSKDCGTAKGYDLHLCRCSSCKTYNKSRTTAFKKAQRRKHMNFLLAVGEFLRQSPGNPCSYCGTNHHQECQWFKLNLAAARERARLIEDGRS